MAQVMQGGERSASVAAMAARVMTEAQRSWGDGVDRATLETCATEAVATLWTESTRITSFIPVLALRDVRDRLDRIERGEVG